MNFQPRSPLSSSQRQLPFDCIALLLQGGTDLFIIQSLEETSRSSTAKRPLRLSLAHDNGLATVLRSIEATFNADVLPPDVELMAPNEFYAAIASGSSRTRPRPEDGRTTQLSYLAA